MRRFYICLLLLAFFYSCENKSVEDIRPTSTFSSEVDTLNNDSSATDSVVSFVSFSKDVLPIYDANCNSSGCHGNGGVFPNLTNFNSSRSSAQTTLRRIKLPTSDSRHMPKNGSSLSPIEIQIIEQWITDGLQP